MKIGIPVRCQNGHQAVWVTHIDGLDVLQLGVPEPMKCPCPKGDLGEGYFATGKPFLLEDGKAGIDFVPIVITYIDALTGYQCEGCAHGIFATRRALSSDKALHAWRRATNYWGEVKR